MHASHEHYLLPRKVHLLYSCSLDQTFLYTKTDKIFNLIIIVNLIKLLICFSFL
jgi:hypothetical protein